MNNNRICSIVQDKDQNIDHYLHYVARLAKDFDTQLELISPPIITNPMKASVIIGSGLPKLKNEARPAKKVSHMVNKLSSSSTVYDEIDYTVAETNIDNLLTDNHLHDSMLWTINQTNTDSLINGIFETIETDLNKKTQRPSLTIPNGCEYVKPEKLLLFTRDIPEVDFSNFIGLMDRLDIEVVYVFQEDDKDISTKKVMESLDIKFKNFTGKTIFVDSEKYIIEDILAEEKPEWIAFANYDKSLLEQLYKTNNKQLHLSSTLPILNF